MFIWSLTTDPYGGPVVTTLHASEADVIASLRENFDPENEHEAVPDIELPQVLIDTQGVSLYWDQHDVTYLVPLSRALNQTYEDYLSDEPDQHGLPDMLTREQYAALQALA